MTFYRHLICNIQLHFIDRFAGSGRTFLYVPFLVLDVLLCFLLVTNQDVKGSVYTWY